jgi:hypothetical protein
MGYYSLKTNPKNQRHCEKGQMKPLVDFICPD